MQRVPYKHRREHMYTCTYGDLWAENSIITLGEDMPYVDFGT